MSLFMQWLSVGVALGVLELIVPGTYLIWFGMAALVVSGLTWVDPGLSLMWQLIWLSVFSGIFVLIGWKVYGFVIFKSIIPAKYRDLNDPVAQLVGKTVKVTNVRDDKLQVAVGDTVWPAVSTDSVAVGDAVVITGSDNNVELNVRKK